MYERHIKIINIIDKYRGEEHVYGLNDCNILVADIIDALCGTEYADKLRGSYDSIISGMIVAKEKVGFSNARQALVKHGEKVDYPSNGDFCIIKHINEGKTFYATTIYWNGKVLLEKDNHYQWCLFEKDNYKEFFKVV